MNPADELRTAANDLRYERQWIRLGHDSLFGALADWLETTADYTTVSVGHPTHVVRALAVARAINGTAP